MRIRSLFTRFRSFLQSTSWRKKFTRRRICTVALIGIFLLTGGIALANMLVISTGRKDRATSLEVIQATDVALVLGANPRLSNGYPNPHYEHRINAAAELYRQGKVRHLLVSGANDTPNYDEPTAMRASLMARGVPAEAITRDFAGLRTLDSVIRAKEIFGLNRLIIVSQRYHLDRALLIARNHNIEAQGYAAADVSRRYGIRTEIREVLARFVAVMDVYVINRRPRHLGAQEPILLAMEA